MYNNNMTQGFFQFNNSIINEILNFTTSNFDLLFVSGKKGTSKSENIEKALLELSEETLIFRHFCFKNTAIDDFLLNFYDSLRNFYLSQKISLKKIATEDFKEKVSHYFTLIPNNCIILVENFENVDENTEIIDFLSYLASYKNVKLIIITRNGDKNLFRFKKVRIKNLPIEQISKEDFKAKLVILTEPFDAEYHEKFYTVTSGLDLYLKMAIKFCSITSTTIPDLLREYERKERSFNVSFEEYLLSKFTTLTPKMYQGFLKFLSVISIPVNLNFIKLFKSEELDEAIKYLSKNYLISFFNEEIYVKDYFREQITKAFSAQEKLEYYSKAVELYEKELEKSPKDRIIRLSRESLRQEIEDLKSLIPSVSSPKNSNTFTYLGITTSGLLDEKFRKKSKLAEKFNRIKEREKLLLERAELKKKEVNDTSFAEFSPKQKEDLRQSIVILINEARNLAGEYKYTNAIAALDKAYEIDVYDEFKIEIALLSGKYYRKLNEFEISKDIYKSALQIAIEQKDDRKSELEYSIAEVDKNLYKMEEAKVEFSQIALNETNSIKFRRLAHLSLGEIYEAEQNAQEAIKHYLEAEKLSLGKDKKVACTVYYRLGFLYDEMGDWDSAKKYYQKNYLTSSEIKENKYYSASLVNIALIYSENSQYKEAIDCLKLALNFDFENDDLENLYLTQKELAKMYVMFDEENAINYYKKALNTAKQMEDIFKIALVYFEVGQYYYDKLLDEKALLNFLNAKAILEKVADKENLKRVIQRIDDIKSRIDSVTFNMIIEKYDEQK